MMDNVDSTLVRWGLKPAASWDDARRARKLYAGKLRRGLPQYKDYIGLTPFRVLGREQPLRLQSDTGFSHRLDQ